MEHIAWYIVGGLSTILSLTLVVGRLKSIHVELLLDQLKEAHKQLEKNEKTMMKAIEYIKKNTIPPDGGSRLN